MEDYFEQLEEFIHSADPKTRQALLPIYNGL